MEAIKRNNISNITMALIALFVIVIGVMLFSNANNTENVAAIDDNMVDATSTDSLLLENEGEKTDEAMMEEDKGDDAVMEEEKATVEVTYTGSGFAPEIIEVKAGQSVTWTNNGGPNMWVASDLHPTHKIFPEFDQLSVAEDSETYSFVFEKVGNWTYHNHLRPGHKGMVIVK